VRELTTRPQDAAADFKQTGMLTGGSHSQVTTQKEKGKRADWAAREVFSWWAESWFRSPSKSSSLFFSFMFYFLFYFIPIYFESNLNLNMSSSFEPFLQIKTLM
jgi:hypothetical protein